MTEMRILTVRQPWAWAIIQGGKDVENRVRNIAGSYLGPVAIHVAQTWAGSAYDYPLVVEAHVRVRDTVDGLSLPERENDQMDPQRGHIIGVVDIAGAHKGHNSDRSRMKSVRSCYQPGKPFGPCSSWALPDDWHLELANPRPLAQSIPFKGALGLRKLDLVTIAQIEAQL